MVGVEVKPEKGPNLEEDELVMFKIMKGRNTPKIDIHDGIRREQLQK